MGSTRWLSRWSGQSGRVAPLSPLLYVLALEPLFHGLREREACPALRSILFACPLSAKVSGYADAITVFVSSRLDIKAVKKAVARYEQIAGPISILIRAKFCIWVPGEVALPYLDLSVGVTDLSASSGCGLGPASNWSEIGRRYKPW